MSYQSIKNCNFKKVLPYLWIVINFTWKIAIRVDDSIFREYVQPGLSKRPSNNFQSAHWIFCIVHNFLKFEEKNSKKCKPHYWELLFKNVYLQKQNLQMHYKDLSKSHLPCWSWVEWKLVTNMIGNWGIEMETEFTIWNRLEADLFDFGQNQTKLEFLCYQDNNTKLKKEIKLK